MTLLKRSGKFHVFVPQNFIKIHQIVLKIFVRLTAKVGPKTRPIPTTGPIPQSDVIPQLGRFVRLPDVGNEQVNNASSTCCSLRCVGLCLLSDPFNNQSVISSGIASLGLCIAARRETDLRKHCGRACCSHEEIVLLRLRRYAFWFILNNINLCELLFFFFFWRFPNFHESEKKKQKQKKQKKHTHTQKNTHKQNITKTNKLNFIVFLGHIHLSGPRLQLLRPRIDSQRGCVQYSDRPSQFVRET